jgi:hypothetical protein
VIDTAATTGNDIATAMQIEAAHPGRARMARRITPTSHHIAENQQARLFAQAIVLARVQAA